MSRLLTVLVECDTGGRRCGVRTSERAIVLARRISALPGIGFGGFMTCPATGGLRDVLGFKKRAKAGVEECGIECSEVSSGGSPGMWHARTYAGTITEYRARMRRVNQLETSATIRMRRGKPAARNGGRAYTSRFEK